MTERYTFLASSQWADLFGSYATTKDEGQPIIYAGMDTASPPGAEQPETWLDLLKEEMQRHGDSPTKIRHSCGFLPHESPDYGEKGWTLWTTKRVYFPEVYDGRYWVRSVSRRPIDQITYPVGGGN